MIFQDAESDGLSRIHRAPAWLAHWPRFCALMVLLFVVRGVFVLSVLPPFEGWDEYQHLAYVAYLDEHDQPPEPRPDTTVPLALYPALRAYPHCDRAVEQIGRVGARSYREHWNGTAREATTQPVLLYQAQQAPLYYRFVRPIFHALWREDDPLNAITALRVINVLLGAAAVYLACRAIGILVMPGPDRFLLAALVATQPLFLLNCARVANDAAAVLLGTMHVVVVLTLARRSYWTGIFLAGASLGAAILAKTTNLSLVPLGPLIVAWMAWQGRLDRRRAALGAAAMVLIAAGIGFTYFRGNLAEFGMLTPMQEAVENRAHGRTTIDLLAGLADPGWWQDFGQRYVRYSLWFGGWSWLQPPSILKNLHRVAIYSAVAGFVLAAWGRWRNRRTRKSERIDAAWLARPLDVLGRVAVVCLLVALGLAYHGLHTRLALGRFAANSWYAAVSFPWLLFLLYQGWRFLPTRWLPRAAALLMLATHVASETHGTLARMTPAFTGEAWGETARARLAAWHPTWLGPAWTIPMLVLMVLLVLIALATWFVASRGDSESERAK